MFAAMLAYVCLVLVRPQDYPQWEDALAAVPMQPAALAVAAGFWLVSSRKTFDAPQFPLMFVFLVVMLVSQVTSGWAGGMVLVVQNFLPVVAAFMLMVAALDSRERLRTMMAVMTLCTAVLALHGIEQAKLGVGWTGVPLSQGTRIQYVGLFNDPNDLGMLFVMCLPMAMYLRRQGGVLGLRRLFWTVVAGVLLYGVYLTDSRGTMLAVVVVLGVYVWQRWGLVAAGTLGAAALAMMMVLLPSRIQELDASEESAMGRIDAWYAGIEMFMDSPLFGVGVGGFTDHNVLTAHNSFVLVLAETGAIGFTVWIAFIGYSVLMLVAVLRTGEYQVLEHAGARAGAMQPAFGAGSAGSPGDAASAMATTAPEEEDEDEVLSEWQQDRAIALVLLLSMSGMFACAFFLSRSYIVILYLLMALPIAHYMGMRERWSFLPAYRLTRTMLRWPLIAGGAAIGLYVLVKLLLSIA